MAPTEKIAGKKPSIYPVGYPSAAARGRVLRGRDRGDRVHPNLPPTHVMAAPDLGEHPLPRLGIGPGVVVLLERLPVTATGVEGAANRERRHPLNLPARPPT